MSPHGISPNSHDNLYSLIRSEYYPDFQPAIERAIFFVRLTK